MSAIHAPFMFAAHHGCAAGFRLAAVRSSADGWCFSRQPHDEQASASRVLLNGQCPPVLFGDPAGDREPEACARRGRACRIEAHESLEDPIAINGWDARSRVRHRDGGCSRIALN
jgi:hypothetical protein